jgi:dihydrodipicolinate synthase/N-acetylneuraminate lyase
MPIPSVEQLIHNPIAHYPSATVACFDPTAGELPRRQLDKPRLRQFLERLGTLNVPAVLIGASTGQGHLRTTDELAEWFAAAAETHLSNTMKTALLRPEDGKEINHHLVRLLVRNDYRVAYVRPGVDLPENASDEAVVANMQPLVERIAKEGLAVGLYSISNVSGVAMSDHAAAALVAGPGGERIVAIKVTEVEYEHSTERFLHHPQLQRLKIVQGWDPHLIRALREGGRRVGVTSGSMSFAVFQYLHMLEAAARQDWREAAASESAVTSLFCAMQDDPRKFADLQRAKYIMGLGHPLLGEVQPEQVERVMKGLESVPRGEDRRRLAQSLDLMGDGPLHERLTAIGADVSDHSQL